MNIMYIFFVMSVFYVACTEIDSEAALEKASYIQNLEQENNISYSEIINTRASYITSMCYTKAEDETSGVISNPCYSCHTTGKIPNYYNDTNLQKEYNFPAEIMQNPFTNIFKDRTVQIQKISDTSILNYIRKSNYFDDEGTIILQDKLPVSWKGYRPDCNFNFDDEGFDKDADDKYTLWRAFRYYPFLGTFWPTNGSTDDVLIRLDKVFSLTEVGEFNLEVYKLNLSIVESIVKEQNIELDTEIDESKYGVDLNQNGVLDFANKIVLSSYNKMSYVGKAKEAHSKGEIHLAPGLFPEGTEFLHSVRYVDWDEKNEHIQMSHRMKELRYAKKLTWKTYSEIERIASAEFKETLALGSDKAVMATYRGNYEDGLSNDIGWIYQGFIEDKKGDLRPQTHEETINCMGCHSHLGATTDSIFAFARKFEGNDKSKNDFGWNHWTQKGMLGVKEPKVNYKNRGEEYEYSFYLQNNHSGNEFRNNDEVDSKFFDSNYNIKTSMIENLHEDISLLLFPSYRRAMNLNKAYRVISEEQSFIYGRDANVVPMQNVYKSINEGQTTKIEDTLVRDY